MLADQNHGDDANANGLRIGAPGHERAERRNDRGDQRGERGIAEDKGHEQPGANDNQAKRRIERQQHTRRRGHALAALEIEKDRKDVSEKHRDRHQCNESCAQPPTFAKHLRQKNCQPALARIAQQGRQGGQLVAAAQHVGCTRVLRTVTARIGQPEQTAGHYGEGNRSEQVGDRQDRRREEQGRVHGHGRG